MTTYGQFVLFGWLFVGVLFCLGFCVQELLRLALGLDLAQRLGATVLSGVALAQIVGWWILESGVSSLRSSQLVLAGLAIAGAAVLTAMRLREKFRSVKISWELPSVAILSTALLVWQWRWMLGSGYVTAVGSNGDIAAYAQIAQHLQSHNFGDVGRIVGTDLGYVGRTDVSGAYILLSMAQVITGRPFHQVMIPAIGGFVVLLTVALYRLIRNQSQVPRTAALLVAMTIQGSFLATYVQANYFLAQLIGMVIMVTLMDCLLGVFDGACNVPGTEAHNFIELLALMAGTSVLLLTYPHMLFAGLPLVVLSCIPIRKIHRLLGLLARVLFAILIGLVLVISKFQDAISRFIALASDQVNGWPLPNYLPTHLLGFMNSESVRFTNQHVIWSVLILAIGCGSLFLPTVRLTLGNVPVIKIVILFLGSYAFFAATSPGTYRQWKWLTFVGPLVAVGLLLPLIALGVVVVRNRTFRITLFALALLSGLLNTRRTDNFMKATQLDSPRVSQDIPESLKKIDLPLSGAVNLSTGPYLGSMWPALFLDPREVRILEPSYYSAAEPAQSPTLVLTEAQFPDWVVRREVSRRYSLVDYPIGWNSERSERLSSTILVSRKSIVVNREESVRLELRITNSGEATWLGGGGFRGAVNLGMRLRTQDGSAVISELGRRTIVPFPGYVLPGRSIALVVDLTFQQSGKYLLELCPVSEQVAWLSDIDTTYGVRIPVEVD